jgi:uncharacterized repeat protein (TIGR03806 family)
MGWRYLNHGAARRHSWILIDPSNVASWQPPTRAATNRALTSGAKGQILVSHSHRPPRSHRTAALSAALLLLAGLQGCDGGARASRNDSGTPPPNPDSGLDGRPTNATCTAWPRPSAGSDISLSRFTNLSFDAPLGLLQAPGDDDRWFVVQQGGVVRQFTGTNPASASVFIDITARVRSGGEMGLLGMAFHPNFPTDNRVFLSYTTGTPLVSRISVFTSSDGGATLDPASETILLTIDQPETNHNGGHIAFGPDGYLYIGIGDGGGGGDRHGATGNGQRLTTLLGKLLRIDVDGAAPYEIPPTNPFAGNARCPAAGRSSGECPEIYAYGFRNPWRWSFDRGNGDLWLADVGQGQWEEVNVVVPGGNYGWRCREGAHDYDSSGTPGCSSAAFIDPVTEYNHSLGNSITGGYVYRGSQSTGLLGRYLFGDFGSGRIWAWIAENAGGGREPTQLLDTDLNIASFGEGNDGELYVVNYGGTLHRINFESTGVVNTAPRLLTDTGCVSSSDPKQPAAGLIPYAINAPFWSDGADKDRWMALPDGQTLTVQTNGDWSFPPGTVLMKNFRLGSRLIETRLLMRHADGIWGGFTYEWNAEQTQATLLEGGAERDVGAGRSWIFPSEGQCLECHTEVAGRALGLETAQLNRTFTYAQTGRSANQLTTLDHIGLLTPRIPDAAAQPVLPDPAGDAPLADRARACLHTNCAQCHQPGGPTPSNMDLRYSTSLMGTNACDVLPASGDLGLGANARLIAPGDSGNSLLVYRMNRRDSSAMPPLGSNMVDTAGVALIAQWIDSLPACQ